MHSYTASDECDRDMGAAQPTLPSHPSNPGSVSAGMPSTSRPGEEAASSASSPSSESSDEDDYSDDSEQSASEESSTNDEPTADSGSDASNLRSRLAAFIPRLAAANRDLAEAQDGDDEDAASQEGQSGMGDAAMKLSRKRKRDGFEIVPIDGFDGGDGVGTGSTKRARWRGDEREDDVGDEDDLEDDSGPYIEMDLSLGVLEEKKSSGRAQGLEGMEGEVLYREAEGDQDRESASSGPDDNDDTEDSNSGSIMDKLTAIGQKTATKKKKGMDATGQARRISEIPND